MTKFTTEVLEEVLLAMDVYKSTAELLIEKLIAETNQSNKSEIEKGNYFEIQNEDLINNKEYLSENWDFDVHGEHCLFTNLATGQALEVYLGNKESIGNLDPYFFYNFLNTTEKLNHLTKHFKQTFKDMLELFEELERSGRLIHIEGVNFRKSITSK